MTTSERFIFELKLSDLCNLYVVQYSKDNKTFQELALLSSQTKFFKGTDSFGSVRKGKIRKPSTFNCYLSSLEPFGFDFNKHAAFL
jgi:hypothetical protein